jgi:DNA-binding CsgD family transcriptional regulator
MKEAGKTLGQIAQHFHVTPSAIYQDLHPDLRKAAAQRRYQELKRRKAEAGE